MTGGERAAKAVEILEANGISSMQGKVPKIEHLLTVFSKDAKLVARLMAGKPCQMRNFGHSLQLSFFSDPTGPLVLAAPLHDQTD